MASPLKVQLPPTQRAMHLHRCPACNEEYLCGKKCNPHLVAIGLRFCDPCVKESAQQMRVTLAQPKQEAAHA